MIAKRVSFLSLSMYLILGLAGPASAAVDLIPNREPLLGDKLVVTHSVFSGLGKVSDGTIYTGREAYLAFGVRNSGETSSGPFWARIWDDTTKEPIVEWPCDAIDRTKGETGVSYANIPWTFKTPGWHTLILTVDSKNNVVESNEGNNTYTKQIYVNEPPNRPPATPNLISPSNGVTPVGLTPKLQASAFSDPDAGDTHANSQWQVDNNSNFTSPEWDSGQSFTAGTQVSVPSGKLSSNTTYYWRVQYKDNHGAWSGWSASRSFTTLNNPPATPTLISPSNGATMVGRTPALQASAFSDADAGDTHANSQWQVDNDRSFASPEWDSGQSYQASTQVTVPAGKLNANMTYYWRVRYKDNRGAWSNWSSEWNCVTFVRAVILYVDAKAAAGGDGTTWSKSFSSLQQALAAASASLGAAKEIRVAAGVYRPNTGMDPKQHPLYMTFQLLNYVVLQGGYGGATAAGDPNARNVRTYETILSGDIKTGDEPWHERGSLHVVTGSGTDNTAVLDGFTITGGGVKGLHPASQYGGGLYNLKGSPTIRNCAFRENDTRATLWMSTNPEGFGGAVCNKESHPLFENCTFSRNGADYGAAAYNEASQPIFVNCLFAGNAAREGAGLAVVGDSCVTLLNCTFADNKADKGSALNCGQGWQNPPASDIEITNCILWDVGQEIWNGDGSVVTITYSDVRGGQTAVQDPKAGIRWDTGNTQTDPSFLLPGRWADLSDPNLSVEPTDPNAFSIPGDYHLKLGSPCIDKGDPKYIAEPGEVDVGGAPRVINGRIDTGAYEWQAPGKAANLTYALYRRDQKFSFR